MRQPSRAACPNSPSPPGHLRVAVLYTPVDGLLADVPAELRDGMDLAVHARDVTSALTAAGCDASCLACSNDPGHLVTDLRAAAPQVVFNLAESPHGSSYYGLHVAALLELLRLPYTGNGPAALVVCTDKAHTKAHLLAHGIPTAAFRVYASVPRRRCDLSFPLMVKPRCEDASIGISEASIVADERALRRQVAATLRECKGAVLVEGYLPGREFTVGVLGNGTVAEPYHPLPPSELVYGSPHWRVLSYQAKWDPTHPSYGETNPTCPAAIPESLRKRLMSIATTCAQLFGLTGYARVDLRLDAAGRPHVLEVNPNPDLSRGGGFALAAEVAGRSYEDLLVEITRLGLVRGSPDGTNGWH